MFFKVWFVAAIVTIVLTTLSSGNVVPLEQCPGESFEDLQDRIQVGPCGKSSTSCNLQKNTNVTVTFRFSPDKDVTSLTNVVFAYIGGVAIPFFGVDGTDACQHVKRAAADEYVSCPLLAGQDYIYTNVFPILSVYPTIKTKVHWALKDSKKTLICFEVPAAITNAPKKSKN